MVIADTPTLPQVVPWHNSASHVHTHIQHRVVPAHRYKATVQEHGIGLTESCMAMQSWGDVCAADSGLSAVGEVCFSARGLCVVCCV